MKKMTVAWIRIRHVQEYLFKCGILPVVDGPEGGERRITGNTLSGI